MVTIKLEKWRITREFLDDPNPDLSYLGVYHDDPNKGGIDRLQRGDWRRGEARYFAPAHNGPDTEADYLRAEAHNRGEWHMIGVRAKTEIALPMVHGGSAIIVPIHSPGLWGVEGDCRADYLEEIFEQERSLLIDMLKALNVEVVE